MSGWYKVRLIQNPRGPRRRILSLGSAGEVRFNLSQTDKTARDYPEKRIMLDERVAAELKADGDWEIRPSKQPKSTLMSSQLTERRIGPPKIESEVADPKEN